ncbi:hypothetical protein V8C40DRAFT_242891 [Trichoderma camerunense]
MHCITCYSIQVAPCATTLCVECVMSVSIFCSLRPPCRKYAHVAAFGHFQRPKKVDIMKQLMHLVLTGRTGFFFPTPRIKRHSFSSHRLRRVVFPFIIVE